MSPDSVVPDTSLIEWKAQVLKNYENKCANCEKTRQLASCFIVPPEAGGRVRPENGVALCRDCRLAAEGARVLPLRIDNKTPINFLVSKDLHERLESFVHRGSNFGSISALVRRVISSYITDNEMYTDLEFYQLDTEESSSVKVNGWIDGNQYDLFKRLCQERNMTYTDTLKALLFIAMENTVNTGEIK